MIETWFLYFLIFLAGYGLATVINLLLRAAEDRQLRKSCKEQALEEMEGR